MRRRWRVLDGAELYVITCPPRRGLPYPRMVEAAIRGGADLVQFRDKHLPDGEFLKVARAILAVCRRRRVPLIINDRTAEAAIVGADGLHLGQDDLPVGEARNIFRGFIGTSCHATRQTRAALAARADYVTAGPVFGTPTKPGYAPVGLRLVRWTARHAGRTPWVAIGGITERNVGDVIRAGAARVAVVRAVCGAGGPRDIEAAARRMKAAIRVAKAEVRT